TKPGETKRTGTGLQYETLVEGTGPEARPGQMAKIHYVGTFPDGQEFDSSRRRNEPLSFLVGKGEMIRGFEEGGSGMRGGERRKLIVPPELGYGPSGKAPAVPGNATLHFDIELLEVQGTPAVAATATPKEETKDTPKEAGEESTP